jgi:hypothetical protein
MRKEGARGLSQAGLLKGILARWHIRLGTRKKAPREGVDRGVGALCWEGKR